MRFQHWLAGNKNTQSPNLIAWVDTETDQIQVDATTVSHKLRFGWVCFQRTRGKAEWCAPEWFRFTSVSAFWKLVEAWTRPHCKLLLFSHNVAFDGVVLNAFDHLPKRGWTLSGAVVECPPTILTWRREDRCIRWLDTLNFWRMPLDKLGESLGLAKLPMPSASASRAEWDTYCRRDVEVIQRAIQEWLQFLQDYDLGGFAPTLASQAFRAYRHRFMSAKILVDNDARALTLARESYHGGRVECFRLGRIDGPIYALDINSMYPAVMRDSLFPAVLIRVYRDPSLEELARWANSYCVVARIRLKTHRNRFAHVSQGRLMFPVGTFTTTLTTVDVQDALTHNEIVSCDEVALYEAQPLFQEFVEQIYALRALARKRNNPVQVWLLKILMNSLYGKFAQRGQVWRETARADSPEIRVWTEFDYETGETYKYRQFGGLIQEQSRDTESMDSCPAIASHVTAYARARLWSLMQAAGMSQTYYCDTDSLYVSSRGYKRLSAEIDEHALGKLKLVDTYEWLHLRGPKDYETPHERVIKGVKSKALWIGDDCVYQDSWSTVTGLIRAGQLAAPTTREGFKILARVYTKGTVTADGRVLPLRLSE